jgi:tryptophan 2,3-dioxygenase
MSETRAVNYWEYIRVEELLDLQSGLAADEGELENDEVMFIVVHQIFELWFKLTLRELRSLRDLFRGPEVAEQELSEVVRALKRVVTVLGRAVDHFTVMETLTTREYLGFRDKLMPASGFQSAQLREIEILLGLGENERIPLGLEESYVDALRAHDGSESPALRRVLRQIEDKPTVLHVIEEWLFRTPIDGEGPGGESLDRFIADYLAAHSKELDQTCELALARAFADEDKVRLRKRYADEKDALHAFLHPSAADGGDRRRRIRAAILFITTYRELPLLAWPRQVLEGLVELEQQFLVFRQRHARMVERVIGRRTGTGGSSGVDYLDQTALRYRVFRDLWACRTVQIRRESSPPLRNEAYYSFRNE